MLTDNLLRTARLRRQKMTLPQCLSRPIHTILSSTPPCNYSYSTTTPAATTIPTSNWSHFNQFGAHPLLFLPYYSKSISKFHPFPLYSSGSRSISHASVSRTPVNVGYREEQEITYMSSLRVLKQKVEVLGINCDSCTPGRYNLLICPKCKGGQSTERCLSFHISENGDFAMWRCFCVECGWAGQAFADNSVTYDGFNKISKVNCPGQMTVESLGLVPLSEKLTAYFTERMISENTLQRNAVMQISGDQNVIAFTYRRNGVLVNCKYRSLDKKFWQEKGTEKILYGLDDIKEVDEIIIVEGEIDKLAMEEAGFHNCVSVPDGAPQKVSSKELPSLGELQEMPNSPALLLEKRNSPFLARKRHGNAYPRDGNALQRKMGAYRFFPAPSSFLAITDIDSFSHLRRRSFVSDWIVPCHSRRLLHSPASSLILPSSLWVQIQNCAGLGCERGERIRPKED